MNCIFIWHGSCLIGNGDIRRCRVSRNIHKGKDHEIILKNKQCGQGIRKAAVLTAAIVSLSAASVSWAASITIDNRTFVNGSQSGNISVAGGVLAGQFNFNVTSPATLGNVTWNSTLQAFCIDINNSIKIRLRIISLQQLTWAV